MNILFQIIVLSLCFLMFKVKREYKLAILLLGTICFNAIFISFIPFGNAQYLFSFCFLLSERKRIKQDIQHIKGTIIYFLMIIMSIATIILAINSPHYHTIFQIMRLIIIELLAKYLVICYSFLLVKKDSDLTPIFYICFVGLIVLTGFAISNYLMRKSFFINEVYTNTNDAWFGESKGDKYLYADRFRVQAMFINPFNYGYICSILLLFFIYIHERHLIKNYYTYIIAIICCLFGIFTCGSRTILFCAIIGICSYFLIAYDFKKVSRSIIILLIIFCISYNSAPYIHEKIDEMSTMFESKSTVSGSSLDMRKGQYLAAMYYVRNNLLFGRGKDFFTIDMGWKGGRDLIIDKDLAGLEGVLMSHLLERGVIGVLFYLSFYTSLYCFILIHRKKDKKITALCFSVLTLYIIFANMTGELNSVYPTLLIVGIGMRFLYNKIGKIKSRIEK